MAKRFVEGQLGLFAPKSDWKLPTELPDLRGRKEVSIDTESKDDGLNNRRGPGWALGPAGYICGVSWAAEGSVGYAPIAHPDTECFPKENVMRWVDDLFRSGTRIVFHNGPYDLGWLGCDGVQPPDDLVDTSAAAVMLDEQQRSYSLDACCAREGIPGKDASLLADAVRSYGGDPARPQASLWRLPARYVGPYAEQDGVATLELWRRQEPQLRAQGMWDAFKTEMDLIPMVIAMRRRGIRVNGAGARSLAVEFRGVRDEALAGITRSLSSIRRAVTIEDVRSPQWLETHFKAEGIPFPRTAKSGQGSFSVEWMEKSEHWLPKLVIRARQYEEAASKFVENFILGYLHRGRVHAEVHQFKTDDGGTRSQRFSYSNPALQQMPGLDKPSTKAIGTAIRGLFEPEKGEHWGSADYSQQEPRITVHFAAACRMRGADEAVERYIQNPRTDYHQMVADMTGLPRSRSKILNLAMTYGKGKHSTAAELGLPVEEAEILIQQYHGRLPFIKPLDDYAKSLAASRGFIRLIDGARMHYNEWEGGWIDAEDRVAAERAGHRLNPCSLEEARERASNPDHPWSRTRLRRADTRKALNNLVQGSAARQTKRAMLGMWREGILPLIQMHDEIGHSCGSDHQKARVEEIMRDCTKLLVPVVVDHEFGPTWGTAKKKWEEVRDAA